MNLHSALARLEGTFAARIRKGISVDGITLRAADSDRTAFTQLLTMLNEAERLEMLPATTTIADRDGIAHELPTAQVRAMLVQYGGIYQSLWVQKVGLENAIKAAADDASRAAIPIKFA
ncbi:MAG: hypothetical protein EOP83_14540 [Verrucomicrobiaceae bacterium]|nr:MAG: hypothetical protein EOP83_14540 [Verrucomicrobiaceae bacterium]